MEKSSLEETIEQIQQVRNRIGSEGYTYLTMELHQAIESLKAIEKEE